MALHTISEAARFTKKARSTIHRHIKEGKLSKVTGHDGKPAIETAELYRVYGDLSGSDSPATPTAQHRETPPETARNALLEQEIAALKSERDSIREDRDRWIAQAERLTLLLTQDRPRSPSNVARFGWLDKLLGRA